MVDNVVIFALIFLAAAPYLLVLLSLGSAVYDGVSGILVAPVTALVVGFGVSIGYYALLEGYRGQTPGKMLLGLEVIREDTGAAPGRKPPRCGPCCWRRPTASFSARWASSTSS